MEGARKKVGTGTWIPGGGGAGMVVGGVSEAGGGGGCVYLEVEVTLDRLGTYKYAAACSRDLGGTHNTNHHQKRIAQQEDAF